MQISQVNVGYGTNPTQKRNVQKNIEQNKPYECKFSTPIKPGYNATFGSAMLKLESIPALRCPTALGYPKGEEEYSILDRYRLFPKLFSCKQATTENGDLGVLLSFKEPAYSGFSLLLGPDSTFESRELGIKLEVDSSCTQNSDAKTPVENKCLNEYAKIMLQEVKDFYGLDVENVVASYDF